MPYCRRISWVLLGFQPGLEDSKNDNCATSPTSTRSPTSTSTARNRFQEKEAVSGHCGRKGTSRRRSRGTPTVAYKKGEQVRASHQDSWPKHRVFSGTLACVWLINMECIWCSFRKDLQWVLFNKFVPSLIQDGPQCGLVALWMAAQLLQPSADLSMENIVKTAMNQGYTAQGEIFSAHHMALLAEEVIGCWAERLTGGMGGANFCHILKHLADGQPILIPYDEDFNHEPCRRSGHRAHWAVASGVLLGLTHGSLNSEDFCADPALPWLLLPRHGCSGPTAGVQDAFIFAKQGKSLRYQLWSLELLTQSNAQLKEMDPQRAADGSVYIVPQGGVGQGLAGQVVLLHANRPTD
ncbi:actin maturation protease isoform X1 [Paramormyrops kingsleyae]|uniref:actin maturation protease isoform X1 n=1 Tax=Paramormyrops kingsleyae TaxID=1676925 RepID=UPI003B9747EC